MSRRWLWTLLATAAILPFVGLGHPLWEVDDARYAEVPREMVERGDWLTPRLDYLDYVEKPPLPYWLTCVSYSVFHVSEASARLPLALWALAALAGTATLGAWLFGAEIGLASALILATTAAFLGLSHVLTPDLPLSAVLVWTMALWLRAMRRPEDAPWASAAAGACMALAVLCKGLVGVVFPVAWTAALALFFPELRPGYKRSLAGWLIPLFLLIAAPWFLLMERLHPGFFGFFFGEQHFQRFMSGAAKYRRYGPWWYFFPVDLAATLPWTPALGAAALAVVRPGERGAPPPDLRLARQLGLWVLGVFAFFSLSSSKLPTYILPLMPQQAVLAAWILLRAEGAPQSWVRGLAFGLGITLVLALPALG
ncbi:MAG: glycosyltransferase family 39 protein, partial [Elusimicrobia bacterium]|nr:glycosyltransferase family 39 protein [Elusimicrobiota bacterium]